MRLRGPVALMLALLFLPLPGIAEEVDVQLIEDDSGDVALASSDGEVTQADATGQFNDVDLVAAGVWAEDEDSVTFFVEVADLTESSQRPVPFSDPDYHIYFRFGQQGYRATVATVLDNPANNAFSRETGAYAWLHRQVDDDRYRRAADAEAELVFSDDRVLVTVPRAEIVDENQAPLSLNSTLTQFYAVSQAMGWFSRPVGGFQGGGDPVATVGAPRAFDMAPDDGPMADLPQYTLTTGKIKQRGALVATSADPVRWTNGEASTITFVAQLANTGRDDIPVAVGVKGARPEWTVAYSDRLTVPASTSINVTFLVTIPFSHSHGNLHMFEAVFESLEGQDFAATDLGVYWPSVPQPAGHHDRIWFHSGQPEEQDGFLVFDQFDDDLHAWMSAAEDEEDDEGLPVPSDFVIPPTPFTDAEAIAFWRVALEPELRMGLDFRPDEAGSAEITVEFPVTVADPFMEFTLYHQQGEQRRGGGDFRQTELAVATSETVSGTVSGRQTFSFDLEVLDEADDVPYTPEGNLVASIVVRATFIAGGGFFNPEQVAPKLLPEGSFMDLPLNEYQDPLDLSFQTDGSLEISAGPEGQQRLVNRDRTVVYTFDLSYQGSDPATFGTTVTGQNAEWAEVVGDTSFAMEPGTTRTMGLAVTAPRDASDGERADVTLTVIHAANAAVQAGINTVTIVDSSEDIPNEVARKDDLHGELSAKKDAPGLGVFLLLAAFAAVARTRRRNL